MWRLYASFLAASFVPSPASSIIKQVQSRPSCSQNREIELMRFVALMATILCNAVAVASVAASVASVTSAATESEAVAINQPKKATAAKMGLVVTQALHQHAYQLDGWEFEEQGTLNLTQHAGANRLPAFAPCLPLSLPLQSPNGLKAKRH